MYVVSSYLKTRRNNVIQREDVQMSQGEPQSSVLGPLLWNDLNDGVLNNDLREGIKTVTFADDLVH